MQPLDPTPRSTMNVPPSFSAPPVMRRRFAGPVILIVVLILAVWGLAWAKNNVSALSFMRSSLSPDPKLYQAVFLTNGQVYFGKIKKLSRGNIVLTDIFYLQVVQPLQQKPAEGQQPQNQQQPQVNLVKIGSEIHGPTDKMVIQKSNVVFWEDIKPDGTVAKAIAEFKTQKASGNLNQQTPTQQQPGQQAPQQAPAPQK